MKKVIVIMTMVTIGLVGGAYELYSLMPQPIATAVIAEKPGKTMGGQGATLLPSTLSNKQAYLLNTAYSVAKAEGFKNPEIVQSVLLQETQAGGAKSYRVANAGPDAYFGPMQIKLAAARDVLTRNPQLYTKYDFHTKTDDEIKANLILNDKFNIEVATKYLRMLQQEYGFNGRDLLNAYNRGPGGVKSVSSDEFHYAIGAEQKLAAYKRKK